MGGNLRSRHAYFGRIQKFDGLLYRTQAESGLFEPLMSKLTNSLVRQGMIFQGPMPSRWFLQVLLD